MREFTINGARQYGKTITINELRNGYISRDTVGESCISIRNTCRSYRYKAFKK